MITLRSVPLFGSGMAGKSFTVTRQRRLNCYFEQREDGDKSKVVIYGTPGLVPAFNPPVPANSPMRGMLGTDTSLYLVAFNRFLSVLANGAPLATGTLQSNAGNVSMANNSTQVVIADGRAGYLFTPSTGVLTTLAASFPAQARTVTNVSGFFVAEQPYSQNFWVSNAYDGSTWNGLSFGQASAYSDNVVAVDNLSGNLIVFSQQHFEQWQAAGTVPQPFAPILSASREYGLAAIFSRAHVDESIIFLAQNKEGQTQFVQVKGFGAAPVSNPDLDAIVNTFSVKSDAIALSYGVDKHKFYQCTFPSANRSFLYDTSSDTWSETQTGPSIFPVRHLGNFSTYYAQQTVISDYKTSQIYHISPTAYTDNGQIIPREIITRHISSSFNRIRPSSLYLDMEVGVGLQTGQGSLPAIMLQYSKDNGKTWSAERWKSLGEIGEYLARVNYRRFGSSRDCTFRIRMTDPVKFVVTEGAMKIRQKRAA
jgi:hypothetical protein